MAFCICGWLLATLLCALCYDCHKKQIIFYKLLRLITIFYAFRLLFSHFGMYVISYNVLIRKCCTDVVEAVLMPLGMVLKLHTLGFWYPGRKVTVHKLEGTQHVRKPNWRWLESVGKDLKDTGLRNWRCKSQGWEQWRTILKEAKIHQ